MGTEDRTPEASYTGTQFAATRQAHRASETNGYKTKIKENIELSELSGSESKVISSEMDDQLQKNMKVLAQRSSAGETKDVKELLVPRKKFIFFTVSPDELIKWSPKPLKNSLSNISSDLERDALKAFHVILRYMSDYKTPTSELRFIADKGMCVVGLRTELYIQIYKQLNQNPSPKSVLRGWEILCVMTNSFAPPQPILTTFQNLLVKHASDDREAEKHLEKSDWKDMGGEELNKLKIGLMARYSLKRFNITMRTPRGRVPHVEEIEHFLRAPFKFTVFGEVLENIVKNPQNVDDTGHLPRVLSFLAEAVLRLGGHSSEGIFRVPGDLDSVIMLKMRIERGEYDLSGIQDPAVPASLLKMWVRELAEPVIPNSFYTRCLGINRVQDAMDVVDQLPLLNRSVLKYLAKYLQIVGDPENQGRTKMSVSNLAIVFAPNVLRCPDDNPYVILQNTRKEQHFVKMIVNYLDE